jgi:hypothetical protein
MERRLPAADWSEWSNQCETSRPRPCSTITFRGLQKEMFSRERQPSFQFQIIFIFLFQKIIVNEGHEEIKQHDPETTESIKRTRGTQTLDY